MHDVKIQMASAARLLHGRTWSIGQEIWWFGGVTSATTYGPVQYSKLS